MLRVQTESTIDEGGGSSLSYVDGGDWVEYNIDVSYSGVYQIVIKHADMIGAFSFMVYGVLAKSVTIPATSDWQDWISLDIEVSLTKGSHTIKFCKRRYQHQLVRFKLDTRIGCIRYFGYQFEQ